MRLKYKKLNGGAKIYPPAKPGDAGYDLAATSIDFEKNSSGEGILVYGTGLSVEIPTGYVGLLFPRSSVSKLPLQLANSVGVIDSGYRGEIKLKYVVRDSRPTANAVYKVGDKVGQLVIVPFLNAELEEVNELSDTERGSGGFGSTGK